MAVVFRHHIKIDVLSEGFACDGVSEDRVLHATTSLLDEVVVDLVGKINAVAQDILFGVPVPLHEHGAGGVHHGHQAGGRCGRNIILDVVELRQ